MGVEITQLKPDLWEHRLTVGAAPSEVFDYVVDFERHVDWEHDLQAVKLSRGRPGDAGTEYAKTYGKPSSGLLSRIFSTPLRVTCQVKAVDRPTRLAWRQYVSHRAEGPTDFQDIELVVRPHGSGSELVVTRKLIGTAGISADLVAGFSTRLNERLRALPPGAAERLRGSDGSPLFPADATERVLDGHPSRGPGPASLARLQSILDR